MVPVSDMEYPPNGTPRSLHYYQVVVAGISSRPERLSSRRSAECFTNSSADVTGGRDCNFYQRADLSPPFLTACLSLSLSLSPLDSYNPFVLCHPPRVSSLAGVSLETLIVVVVEGKIPGNVKRSRFPGILLKRSDIDFRSEGISIPRNNAFPERTSP